MTPKNLPNQAFNQESYANLAHLDAAYFKPFIFPIQFLYENVAKMIKSDTRQRHGICNSTNKHYTNYDVFNSIPRDLSKKRKKKL